MRGDSARESELERGILPSLPASCIVRGSDRLIGNRKIRVFNKNVMKVSCTDAYQVRVDAPEAVLQNVSHLPHHISYVWVVDVEEVL